MVVYIGYALLFKMLHYCKANLLGSWYSKGQVVHFNLSKVVFTVTGSHSQDAGEDEAGGGVEAAGRCV